MLQMNFVRDTFGRTLWLLLMLALIISHTWRAQPEVSIVNLALMSGVVSEAVLQDASRWCQGECHSLNENDACCTFWFCKYAKSICSDCSEAICSLLNGVSFRHCFRYAPQLLPRASYGFLKSKLQKVRCCEDVLKHRFEAQAQADISTTLTC